MDDYLSVDRLFVFRTISFLVGPISIFWLLIPLFVDLIKHRHNQDRYLHCVLISVLVDLTKALTLRGDGVDNKTVWEVP